ncbi:Gfo/Idh/MocA family protein [Mucisphaera calidilacus]|uniref:Putative oxidoreductase YvaA n=1 Tax=Mucisphaera calidilacus TaxID=2527982 RepID=A0A518BUW0_9BACT|nr:Gfo/Idh/MocA family oxidoreductase [Mucisphaera calidilacus]QDU70737.1 putative oxidoreductase YvaA [Mucisphaera calidilacus]
MIQQQDSSSGLSPLRVGVIGLGRSGFNIHCKWLSTLPEHFAVAAVADPDRHRCQEARQTFGAQVHNSVDDLIHDGSLDVVVVASPNLMHEEQACSAMQAGRHVVVEKPLALSTQGADRMIACAEETGRVLAPFQNRRFEPHFRKVREVLGSGILGRIVQIRIEWSFFTRRWDWQTLRSQGGGSLHNHGAHLLDHALELFGEGDPEVFVDMQHALSMGDAEDHVKVILRGEGHPTIDIESSSCCVFPEDRWHVWGTAGGLRGTTDRLEWRWVDWNTMPERHADEGPAEGRAYQHEAYEWQSASWEDPKDEPITAVLFYRNLLDVLRGRGTLTVTPESVRRQMAVLDQCHAQMAC